MARRSNQGLTLDFRPIIEELGAGELIRLIGLNQLIDEVGAEMTPEQRRRIREVLLREQRSGKLAP